MQFSGWRREHTKHVEGEGAKRRCGSSPHPSRAVYFLCVAQAQQGAIFDVPLYNLFKMGPACAVAEVVSELTGSYRS